MSSYFEQLYTTALQADSKALGLALVLQNNRKFCRLAESTGSLSPTTADACEVWRMSNSDLVQVARKLLVLSDDFTDRLCWLIFNKSVSIAPKFKSAGYTTDNLKESWVTSIIHPTIFFEAFTMFAHDRAGAKYN